MKNYSTDGSSDTYFDSKPFPKTLLILFKSLIRSRIEYGGFLISPCSKDTFAKLERIQNKALRSIMGYRKSTPINVILSESKVPYLDFRFKFLGYKYVLKCMSYENKLIIDNLESLRDLDENFLYANNYDKSLIVKCYDDVWFYKDSIICSNVNFKFHGSYVFSLFKPDIDFKSGKEIRSSAAPNLEFKRLFGTNSTIHVFTDGSKMFENDVSYTGFAVWCENNLLNFSYKISDHASIFTAECMAILCAVKRVIECNLTNVIIFSDSESVLKALYNVSSGKSCPIINDLRQKLAVACESNISIKLVWTPAHIGVAGNEKADENAKIAAKNGDLLDEPIPVSDLFFYFKRKCIEENNVKLISIGQEKGSFYFNNFYSDSKKPWFQDFDIPRRAICSINRVRCNHSSLNSSLYRQKIVADNRCKCGEDIDTIEHVFWNCNLYVLERSKMLNEIRKVVRFEPYSIISFISSLKNDSILSAIVNFIMSIDLKI